MAAAVVITGELQIMFSIAKDDQTYAVMEAALVAAGFTDYTISRQPYDNYMDVTISLRPPRTLLTGIVIPFPAKDTLNKLATAAGKFGD